MRTEISYPRKGSKYSKTRKLSFLSLQKSMMLFVVLAFVAMLGMVSCSTSNDVEPSPEVLKININATSNMVGEANLKRVKGGRVLTSEKEVKTISYFVFDRESKLLEKYELDLVADTPQNTEIIGESKVGEIRVELPNSKAKSILAIANRTQNDVRYPLLEEGVTNYDDFVKAMLTIGSEDDLQTPFVMGGHATTQDGDLSASLTLRRTVAKLTIVNKAALKGLSIANLQLKNVSDRAFIFANTMPSNVEFIDYSVVATPAERTDIYVLPLSKELNKMTLSLTGTLKGDIFNHELIIQPLDAQKLPSDIVSNHKYTVSVDVDASKINLNTEISIVEDWAEGGDTNVTVPSVDDGNVKLIKFNGLMWADRNLGATNNNLDSDWDNSIGLFYQWGRNTGFSKTGFETISGPISVTEANEEANINKFIAGGFRDWASSSNNMLWQSNDQPCGDELRLPTDKELQGIFTAKGVITNMIGTPKIEYTETLVSGQHKAHYWGDNSNKRIYGIKAQGTAEAYYMMWEYLLTKQSNPYLKISRWKADENASFLSKSMVEVRNEFESFTPTDEVLILPGAGFITGSNGQYNQGEGGYYWSSSVYSDGKVGRAEFNTGKMSMTEPYNSRVSGHTIRCIAK